MSDTAGQRILTLDVAKGLGIVLVVLGHNPVFREGAHPLYEAIYLFHMPLFFFLSGITFRMGPPGEALIKRARALLVPYFVMGALAVLMAAHVGGLEAAINELLGTLYGTGHTLRFVPLWFLPCLFVVSMSATLLLSGLRATMSFERFEQRRMAILSAIAVVGMGVGSLVLVSQKFAHAPHVDVQGRPLGLPWSLDLLPLVLVFFVVGTLAARAPTVHRFPQPWIVMLASAGVLAICVSSGVSLDLNYRRMVHPVGVLVAVAAGVAMLLAAATLVSRVRWGARVFGYLGSASLVIFMLHSPLQRRVVDGLVERGVNGSVVVMVSVGLTLAVIAAFDVWVLRRVSAVGWVIYPKKPSIAGRLGELPTGTRLAAPRLRAVLSAASRLRAALSAAPRLRAVLSTASRLRAALLAARRLRASYPTPSSKP